MTKPAQIHRGKQPRRPHFIKEWAELRGYDTQAELVEALNVDKGTVSRWYAGASPGEEWQEKLRALFNIEDETGVFRSPDDDWLVRFFKDRQPEEIDRIKQTLEAAFPIKKTGR